MTDEEKKSFARMVGLKLSNIMCQAYINSGLRPGDMLDCCEYLTFITVAPMASGTHENDLNANEELGLKLLSELNEKLIARLKRSLVAVDELKRAHELG